MKKRTIAVLLSSMMVFTPVAVSAEEAAGAAESAAETVPVSIEEEVAEAVQKAAGAAVGAGNNEILELLASDMEKLFMQIQMKGDYVEFDGYKIWLPEEMKEVTEDTTSAAPSDKEDAEEPEEAPAPSEEEAAEEFTEKSEFEAVPPFYSIVYTDGVIKLEAGVLEGFFESIEDLEAYLKVAQFDIDPIKINGMDGFMYIDGKFDQICVDLFDEGKDIEACFSPASKDDVFGAMIMLLGTLQKAE